VRDCVSAGAQGLRLSVLLIMFVRKSKTSCMELPKTAVKPGSRERHLQ